MKKIKEISLTPEILSPLAGHNDIYQLVQGSIIIYDDNSTSKGNVTSTKYFKQVDDTQAGQQGIIKFNYFDTETFEINEKYLEPIKVSSQLHQLEKV